MKKNLKLVSLMRSCRWIIISAFIPFGLFAQTDTTKKAETLSISPSLQFTTVQRSDNTIDLKAALRTKFEGNSVRLPQLKITFYQKTGNGDKELGHVLSDNRGVAVLNYKSDSLVADKDGKINLKASFAGIKNADPIEEELTIKKARLEISTEKEDSSYKAKLKLIDLSTGTEKPIPATNLSVYVKRSFYPLKIGEGQTDADGNVSVDVPNNLPGNANGNITLLGRLDENETYGMLEAIAPPQKWGVAVSTKINIEERALWSTHPPIWMLITFIVLMTAVWGHYIVIIFELFRLRKEEPHESPKATI